MASKWRQVGLDIDGDAVERHPAPQPHADGGDLVLETLALVRPSHPDADAILAPLAAHVEGCERPDDPFLQTRHIGPHVRPPALQVEHHIGHPLAGAVIGDLPAAPGGKHRKAGIEQVGRPCRWCRRCRAGGVPAARPVRAPGGPRYRRRGLPWPRPPRDRAPGRPISAIPRPRRRRGRRTASNRGFGGH